MSGEFLNDRFIQNMEEEAIVWQDSGYSYAWLLERIKIWRKEIQRNQVPFGSITAIQGDFSPSSITLFLALLQHDCVLVPISAAAPAQLPKLLDIAQVEFVFSLDTTDRLTVARTGLERSHPLFEELRMRSHAGLVLFSSGSTGTVKAAVHDMPAILRKFDTPGRALRTIPFLRYDHIGGLNTMLHVLSSGGCLVIVQERTPDAVLEAVQKHRVQLLPTSPTFINLILISEAYRRYDLSSLQMITYGTETMPESRLQRLHQLLPHIHLLQTYGLTELGILRSKSRGPDSLWLKLSGTGFQTRIVEGTLQIKAESAMLGYMNAPSPFTEDGWFETGDAIEVDGDFIRILGRRTDVINVGGEKVFPAEVENVIYGLENVAEVIVHSEKNAILGEIVCAKVRLRGYEDHRHFVDRLKSHCRQQLVPFKVPVKITIAFGPLHTPRFKKQQPSSSHL